MNASRTSFVRRCLNAVLLGVPPTLCHELIVRPDFNDVSTVSTCNRMKRIPVRMSGSDHPRYDQP